MKYPLSSIDDVYVSVVFSALIFLLAYVFYVFHAKLIVWQEGLTEAKEEEFAALRSKVDELADRMGCRRPRIFLSNNYRRQAAKVLGFRRRKLLKLDSGLLLVRLRAPEKFEAIVLHELAHIKNGDIFKGYYSRCLFWVSLVAALPYILYRGYTYIVLFVGLYPGMLKHLEAGNYKWFSLWHLQNIPSFLSNVAPFVFMQIILVIEYCAILRVREHHADWTASVHGARDTLISILEGGREYAGRFSLKIFRRHPCLSERADFIRRPEYFAFRMSNLDVFLASYTFYTLVHVSILVADFFSEVFNVSSINDVENIGPVLLVMLIATLGILYASIGWSGMIQKYSAGEWLRKSGWRSIFRRGIQVFLVSMFGVFAGTVFWPENLSGVWSVVEVKESILDSLVFLSGLLISACVVFFFTRFWISRSEGKEPPKSLFLISNVVGFVALSVGVATAFVALDNDVKEVVGMPLVSLLMVSVLEAVVVFLLMFALSWFFLRKRTRIPSEAIAPSWLLFAKYKK